VCICIVGLCAVQHDCGWCLETLLLLTLCHLVLRQHAHTASTVLPPRRSAACLHSRVPCPIHVSSHSQQACSSQISNCMSVTMCSLVFGDTLVADTVPPSAQTTCSHSQQSASSQTISGISAITCTMSNSRVVTQPASLLFSNKQLHVCNHVFPVHSKSCNGLHPPYMNHQVNSKNRF